MPRVCGQKTKPPEKEKLLKFSNAKIISVDRAIVNKESRLLADSAYRAENGRRFDALTPTGPASFEFVQHPGPTVPLVLRWQVAAEEALEDAALEVLRAHAQATERTFWPSTPLMNEHVVVSKKKTRGYKQTWSFRWQSAFLDGRVVDEELMAAWEAMAIVAKAQGVRVRPTLPLGSMVYKPGLGMRAARATGEDEEDEDGGEDT